MSAVQGRLVGRTAERDRLLDALAAAGAGKPATVLVSGEAGIGKTRLIEELTARASEQGFVVAAAGCSPLTIVDLPFGPIADLVADLLAQVDVKDAVPEQVWRGLGPLVGHPGVIGSAGVPFLDQDGTRLFAGFGSLLAAVTAMRPTLLVIEDAHWADPASIDLLTHLTRRLRRDRMLLVVTHRPVSSPTGAWLRTALAEWLRQPTTIEVPLGPLAATEISEIIVGHGRPADSEHLDRMCRLAEGIPFFAVHLATHFGDRAVPARLQDVLTASLAGLTDAGRSMLLLLAVFGDLGNDDRVLVTASGSSAGGFAALVRDLRDRGVLVVRSGVVGFRHALLREVLLADALPIELRRVNERICDAMTHNGFGRASGEAGRLAHHQLGCGRLGDALGGLLIAAREAQEARAFADALAHYRAALDLWSAVPDPELRAGSSRVQVGCAAAAAARWSGESALGLALLDDVSGDLTPRGRDRAAWQHVRGQILSARGDVDGALVAQQSAATLLEPFPQDPLRPGVLAAVAHALMVSGRAVDAERAALEAAALAEVLGVQRDRVQALITAGAAQAQLGRIDQAVKGLEWCLGMARDLDDLELVTRSYGNLAFALGTAGRERELLQVTATGIAECRKYGPVTTLASTLVNNQVNALFSLGEWEQARRAASEALRESVSDGLALHLHLRLADLAVAQGRDDDVQRQLGRIVELGGSDPYALFAVTMLSAERALWQHDPSAAAALIAGALPRLAELDDPALTLGAGWLGLRAAADLAELQLPRRSGEPSTTATDLLRAARAACSSAEVPTAAALLDICNAEFARIAGTDTADVWAAAADSNRVIEHPYALGYCLLHQGIALLRSQARVAATRALSEALSIAERLAARPLLDQVRMIMTVSALPMETALSRADGPVRSTMPGRSGRAPGATGAAPAGVLRLTGRERQVLALLTTGATNRTIGRQLFISERTASVHVSNILTKMGAANRTEAARMAVRLNLDTDSG